MSAGKLRITLLADEWKSSKGGLSTMNRELAIQFAKHPKVAVTFFIPKCTEEDRDAASSHNIRIVKAKERPGFEPIDWLCFPPKDLVIDIIIGHGVKLGRQAQVIRDSHHCAWVQVVHTAPEELAMYKTYPGAISKGDKKQWTEDKLCEIADLLVAVGPKLHDLYSASLCSCGKYVFNLTPGIFTELSSVKLSTQRAKTFRVLVFGRGDSEDFELKGFDIAAKAVAKLNDRSYHLIFIGASENEEEVKEKFLAQGISPSQLRVRGYVENRNDLVSLLSRANLVIMPSRTEGFGLTGLEALSAGLPFLVSQNSGFGEALQEIPLGSSCIVDTEDPGKWAEAIKGVREKGREAALKECQELRTRYAEKYSWEQQCNDLVEKMVPLVNVSASEVKPAAVVTPYQNRSQAANAKSERNAEDEQSIDNTSKCEMGKAVSFESLPERLSGVSKDELETRPLGSVSQPEGKRVNSKTVGTSRQKSPLQEDQSAIEKRRERDTSLNIYTARAKHSQGARPKEMLPSSTGKTEKIKENEKARKRVEETNLLGNVRETVETRERKKRRLANKWLQQQRKEEKEKGKHGECQKESENEDIKRRQEYLKRLQLGEELLRRRDELFNYRFGKKTGLDNFLGLEIEDVTQLRIGVFGPAGSGKSSFINTCERTVWRTERGCAPVGSTGRECTITLHDYLPELFFRLVDTRCFFSFDDHEVVEFKKILYGKLQSGDNIVRNRNVQAITVQDLEMHRTPTFAQRLHGIIIVIKADDVRLGLGILKDYLGPFRDVLQRIGIEPLIVCTHQDRLRSRTEEDIEEVLHEVWKIAGEATNLTFLMSNYTEDNKERRPETERVIFNILDCALIEAEKAVLIMKQRGAEKMA